MSDGSPFRTNSSEFRTNWNSGGSGGIFMQAALNGNSGDVRCRCVLCP